MKHFFILLLLLSSLLHGHMRYGDPLPEQILKNRENPVILNDWQAPDGGKVLGLHYYYAKSPGAQEILANLMQKSGEPTQISCAWIIAHCNGAALDPNVRDTILASLTKMTQSANDQARRASAAAIGANNFREAYPQLIRLLDDKKATVRYEAVGSLTNAHEKTCKLKIQSMRATEKNNAVRRMINLYLEWVSTPQ